MEKKKIKRKVNIREFQRSFYKYAGDFPLLVFNSKTGKPVFVVISPKEGGEMYDIRTESSVQPNGQKN